MNLTHHFLIAMPNLRDPNFYHTVTYVCSHNEQGAIGIVVNKPLDVILDDILQQMDMVFENKQAENIVIHDGGPIQTGHGFILHRDSNLWASMLKIGEQNNIMMPADILRSIAKSGPGSTFIAMGYVGWSAGQLEEEMQQNVWLSIAAESRIIFDTPVGQRWSAAVNLLGIDINQLSSNAGHA